MFAFCHSSFSLFLPFLFSLSFFSVSFSFLSSPQGLLLSRAVWSSLAHSLVFTLFPMSMSFSFPSISNRHGPNKGISFFLILLFPLPVTFGSLCLLPQPYTLIWCVCSTNHQPSLYSRCRSDPPRSHGLFFVPVAACVLVFAVLDTSCRLCLIHGSNRDNLR